MPNWSISAELFSLILVVILILSFHNRRRANYPASRLYQICLWGSAGTIAVNLLCVLTIQQADVLPLWVNLLLNSVYFLSITALSTLTTHYLFHLLLEHTYKSCPLRKVQAVLTGLYAVYVMAIIINLYSGFKEVDPDAIKLIYTLGGTKKDTLFKVILPSSVPFLLSTFKVNIGLCLVGVVIGEFIGARSGLGYLIIYGSQVFQLNMVIMCIIVLCIIATLLYAAVNLLEKQYLKRH